MISCILVFYIALSRLRRPWTSPAFRPASRHRRRLPRTPMRSTRDGRTSPSARAAAAHLGEAPARRSPRDFESAWKLARARYWLGGHAPEAERKAILEAGIAAGRIRRGARAESARRPLLDCREHGRARRVVRPASGLKYRGDIKDELLTVLQARPGASSRDPPTAPSAAGTTKCRACSAARTRSPRNTCAGRCTYAPQSTRVALLPRRNAARRGSSRRRARRAPARPRRAARSGLGAGGSGVQGSRPHVV